MATITLPPSDAKYRFSIVPNIFKQALADTDADAFDYAKENFGLIDQVYPSDDTLEDASGKTQWQRFEHYIHELNKNASPGVEYKVLYLGRHGQGYHNVAETRYGTKLWDPQSYWAKQEGDEHANWADAHLTPIGKQQALDVNTFWRSALAQAKIPAPEIYYTSPFYRCLQTSWLSFHDLPLPSSRPFTPIVVEGLRETNGVHTCDRRGPSSIIRADFPSYSLDPALPETDETWTPEYREKPTEHILREHAFLEKVWGEREGVQWVSFTAHSGTCAAVLGAVGHRRFGLPTGGVIPIVVKGEKLKA
ncbi:phosphoglycerate mutase family protein [Aureobasidium subglaciale]|nr:phosphoglycerate mutase family protein [Aureobasidium subglaciale]KAI5215759.1 phosphoglycerate mutase family protein [Aureobasidium subglaciale]KAI5219010.1 phosphoglycerate mutase family protein [Aureobasidium subglaciale]KAI5256578.1 phosphoglycerate mutase family protein [Aureobasidium subglaciale]